MVNHMFERQVEGIRVLAEGLGKARCLTIITLVIMGVKQIAKMKAIQ